MKKILLFFVISILTISCQNEDISTHYAKQDVITNSMIHKIDKEEALNIADMVIFQNANSRHNYSNPTFDYVLSSNHSASRATVQDTLAYVINYPNENGFVIVSSSKHIYPVLAFSDKGNFSFENEISKINFIDKIELYLTSTPTDTVYEVFKEDFLTCGSVLPMVKTSIHQYSPWNKYVEQEHPNCPAGCLAVATALAIIHSQYYINYHNVNYPVKSIVDAINNGTNSTSENLNVKRRIVGMPDSIKTPPYLPKYTYEQAVDSLAKIIYWIGKDTYMDYNPNGSGTEIRYVRPLFVNLDLDFSYILNYSSMEKLIDQLIDNNIILMSGTDLNNRTGHAWIIDGCTYCYDNTGLSKYKNELLHCDWGWGGTCNGYYQGRVFSAGGYDFTASTHFVLKREWK